MKKVKFFLGLFLISLMVFSAILITQAENVTLRLGHIFGIEDPMHKAAIKLSEEVEKASNGTLKIEVLPASQLGGELVQWEALSAGLQDMSVGDSGFLWDPRYILLDAPFTISGNDHLKRIWASSIGDELKQVLIDKANIRILGQWYFGTRTLTTSEKIIRTPEDMKGFKIRVPEKEAMMLAWTLIGASPTPIAWGELYLALKQGIVEGQESPLTSMGGMKFYEVQKYIILTNHITQNLHVVINEQVYQSLSKEHQEILENTVKKVAEYEEQLVTEGIEEWLKIFEEAGMEIISPDRDAFVKVTKEASEILTEKYNLGDLAARIKALSD